MPKNSARVPLVRCPKCGRLLPELPPYSVYCCGGCGGFLRAEKKSPVNDDVSANSSEGGFSEGVDKHGGIVGIEHDSERRTPIRVRFRDSAGKSPLRETDPDGLDDCRNSPIQGNDRNSPLIGERGDRRGKSPAFSVRGGIGKAPVREREDRRSEMRENLVDDHEEIEGRDRVESIDEPVTDWLQSEAREEEGARRAYGRGKEYGNMYDRRVLYDEGVARGNRGLRTQDEYLGEFRKPRKDERILSDGKVPGVQGRVPVSYMYESSNYRAELLSTYNELHEQLIRVGDLISYDGRTRMRRPHYISTSEFSFHDNPSSSQPPGRTIHHQPPYYHEKFASQTSMDSTYDPRRKNVRHPNSLSSHQRSSVDSKSDEGSSAHEYRKKELVGNEKWKPCRPIAGGAPFVICYSCFQLMRLPEKLIAAKKKQFRLQCGSCRTILSLDFNMKRSLAKPNSADIRKSESYEFVGNGSYTFIYTDSEPSSELEDRRIVSAEAAPSSQAYKDEHFSEARVDQNDASSEAGNPSHPLRPPPGSPLRDNMDESDTLNQDRGAAEREITFVAYVENAAARNELELCSDEISKTDTSQGSTDRNGEDRFSEANELSLSAVSLNTSLAKTDVFVNGKPITADAVKMAEKMAGPISPGDYWYDSRAGFWGVMGDHCLGIIPPCIEEFSSLMPANCSGGDTCIYVNGRELHENDLDVLSIRGLPRRRYKYYLVDPSGKVQDHRTGAVILNLGKLAPTVESKGCGFGMQAPGTRNG